MMIVYKNLQNMILYVTQFENNTLSNYLPRIIRFSISQKLSSDTTVCRKKNDYVRKIGKMKKSSTKDKCKNICFGSKRNWGKKTS